MQRPRKFPPSHNFSQKKLSSLAASIPDLVTLLPANFLHKLSEDLTSFSPFDIFTFPSIPDLPLLSLLELFRADNRDGISPVCTDLHLIPILSVFNATNDIFTLHGKFSAHLYSSKSSPKLATPKCLSHYKAKIMAVLVGWMLKLLRKLSFKVK